MDAENVDFVIAAWQDGGVWNVESLPARTAQSVDAALQALAAHPADAAVLGMLSITDDYFIVIRTQAGQHRFLLSDGGAALEDDLAEQIVERLELDVEDVEELVPVGDLSIVADFGMSATELSTLAADDEMFPDEILSAIAQRIGFGDQFDSSIESTDA